MRIVASLNGWTLLLLALVLALAACSREEEIGGEIDPTNTPSPTVTPPPTQTATATPTVTPTLTPEPIEASVDVADQTLEADGRLLIERIVIPEDGWVVIHADGNEEAGEVLGYSPVAAGENQAVVVEVDPLQVSPGLVAMLHVDSGEVGIFEFPGPDRSLQVDSEPVMASFDVDVLVSPPEIVALDQEVLDEGLVVIDEVSAPGPGWIALHADDDGSAGRLLGFAPVKKGGNREISIAISWREATPTLHAVLYEDRGESHRFEYPETDLPVVTGNEPVMTSFAVRLPPDMVILDQPVVDGEVVVDRVISYGPGWLVVYFDDDGSLGNIIGWAMVEDGLNEQIVIPVRESAVTPTLFVMLHEDLETVGEFGFPRTDPPVMYHDRLPNPFTLRTDGGNYLITRDQALSEDNSVTIPLVVVDVTAWVVLRADQDGQPGEIAGMTWLPVGINRDVVVELDPDLVATGMLATLHLDAGTPREFNFPEGLDLPLQRNRNQIISPFQLQPADEES